jgi:hypothetical protein
MPVLTKLILENHTRSHLLAKLPTAALILTRKALLKSSTNKLEEQLELEKIPQKAGRRRISR